MTRYQVSIDYLLETILKEYGDDIIVECNENEDPIKKTRQFVAEKAMTEASRFSYSIVDDTDK